MRKSKKDASGILDAYRNQYGNNEPNPNRFSENHGSIIKPKKPIFKRWWFWLIIVVLVIGAVGGSGDDENNDPAKNADSSKVSEQTDNQSSKDSKTIKSTAAAIEVDKKIYEIVLASEKSTSALIEGMGIVGEGGGSLLELYDLAKQVKDNQFAAFSALSKLSNKENADYIDAAQLYAINGQQVAEDVIKYIDKNEMKYLSRAKENMEATSNYVMAVVGARMEYLASQGLTNDEIIAILDTNSAE